MYVWERMALKGSLIALKSYLTCPNWDKETAISGGVEILEAILKNLDNFDIEEKKK